MTRQFINLVFLSLVIILHSGVCTALSHQSDKSDQFEQIKYNAEREYVQSSYSRAHELYEKAADLSLNDEQQRWVQFRLADSAWRSQAATDTSDSTIFEESLKQLQILIRDAVRPDEQDQIWALVHESIGDYWWSRRQSRNWSSAWQHYEKALDWYAGSTEIESARRAYLDIVWRISNPSWQRGYGSISTNLPLEIIENADSIAVTTEDKAHTKLLLAYTLYHRQNDFNSIQRIKDAFQFVIEHGKLSKWYDDALYSYAQWLCRYGQVIVHPNGQWQFKPDYVEAVRIYRKIITEFEKGETQYFDNAKRQIAEIVNPVINVSVSNTFLPGSEIQYYLHWRNVNQIDFSLHKVDLTRDVNFSSNDKSIHEWIGCIDISSTPRVQSWNVITDDDGTHQPGNEQMHLDDPLTPGAYIILASAGGKQSRELVLVTDTSLVIKTDQDQILVYCCDAVDGSPKPDVRIRAWNSYHHRQRSHYFDAVAHTDEQGLCVFDQDDLNFDFKHGNRNSMVFASDGEHQALAQLGSYYSRNAEDFWRIYAYTDRPAYRPDETVRWKFIARQYINSTYSTPEGETIEYTITDPQGSKIKTDTVKLNGFGSAFGEFELAADFPLGEYRVSFERKSNGRHIGNATLFRLEEYKLPEFKVSINTPEEDGKKKAFRLGDDVQVDITAEYYFGGPVVKANVELLVYQRPYYHWWQPPHKYPWCYEDTQPHWRHYGNEQVIKRETLKTDEEGNATLTFDTPFGHNQDLEYRIEARVTDASRREIISSDTVRVTKQRYYVYAHPKHQIYQPNDKVEIDFKALDPNQEPVEVTGRVIVTRQQWTEIWIDPEGNEIHGEMLEKIRRQHYYFPPSVQPPHRPWRQKIRGYVSEEVLTTLVSTDELGEASLTFTPQQEGHYLIDWTSDDPGGPPIKAQTFAWVVTDSSTDIGYRQGNLEIIVDKDTFQAGQTAPVMISTPTNNRYVLFSIEGNDLHSYQLVQVAGTVKLLQIPIDEQHIPNIFLSAAMVFDSNLHQDVEQVVVPPVEQFLEVEVLPNEDLYQPQDEGTYTIKVTDHEGEPVIGEVSLGIIDESVYYIQSDYAGDPRPFFFDQRQSHRVQTSSTSQWKSYVRLTEYQDDRLVDEKELSLLRKQEMYGYAPGGYRGYLKGAGVGGGGGHFGTPPMEAEEMRFDRAAGESVAKMAAGQAVNSREFLGAEIVADAAMSAPMAPDGDPQPAIQVRSDFRSTIHWMADIVTDSQGSATVDVKFADSLTTWDATARVCTTGNQFGIGKVTTRTRLPLLVRLQAPRFFVVGDQVTISAVVNNNTDDPLTVTASLEADDLEPILSSDRDSTFTITVPANGEARVDRLFTALAEGDTTLRAQVINNMYSDAMEKTYPVYEHGIEKFLSKSGKVRGDEVSFTIDLPAERRDGSTNMMVQITPSMAVTMLDALPYLIDYPYGCTEQTMSRFLPAAITAKTLTDLGLDPDEAMGKVFGGIEQEFVAKTHKRGKRHLEDLDFIIDAGLQRLYDFQHSDGGWGWWKKGSSDHFMTAYVLWGMTIAAQADVDIDHYAMQAAAQYLAVELVEEENSPDTQAWMLHALSLYSTLDRESPHQKYQIKAYNNLWQQRDALNAYTRALLALTAHFRDDPSRARILIDNLENGVQYDERPDTSVLIDGQIPARDSVMGTAHWGEDGIYWRWSDGGVEATAFALRALLAIDPDHQLIKPVTNWLIKNRRGAQWSNTRDTAIVILTLNDYLRQSGELANPVEYELLVNGQIVSHQSISGSDLLQAPSTFHINDELIEDGVNEIIIRRLSGDGSLYFAADVKFFSLEEHITPAGNEIFVRRDYFKLQPTPTLLKGYQYEHVPLKDNDSIASGERIKVVVTVEAKNHYEYLVFEDLKPAGFEAVQIRSGEDLMIRELKSSGVDYRFSSPGHDPTETLNDPQDYTGRQYWVYQELRDRKVAMFVSKLPEGTWEITYELRAETPGRFHALPLLGHAMYVPEIRANGQEVRIEVTEREED